MDSFQLRYALIKSIDGKTIVCALDQLKHIKENNFYIIFNNQTSNQPGMHWLALYKAQDSEEIEFFDSFAMPVWFYGDQLLNFCQSKAKSLKYSIHQYQSNLSDACGKYCVYFLSRRYSGESFNEILNSFSMYDLRHNDNIVETYINDNFKFPSFSDCEAACKKECAKQGIDFSSVCIQKNHHCLRISQYLESRCRT
jgi:hypothetical protein